MYNRGVGVQKVSFSPSNLRSKLSPVDLAVPQIYFGMPPLPLVKGVQNATAIGIRGISNGSNTIAQTTISPESSGGTGEGSIKRIDFGGIPAKRGNHSKRSKISNGTSKAKASGKKVRVLLRSKNGKFTKKGK